jgi:hypothetical protein
MLAQAHLLVECLGMCCYKYWCWVVRTVRRFQCCHYRRQDWMLVPVEDHPVPVEVILAE